MRNAWSAPASLALAALILGGTVVLWKLNHQEEVWPPIDRTARYSYCQLEDQVYLRIVDHNTYVILEHGGPYVAMGSDVAKVLTPSEYSKLQEQFPNWTEFVEEREKREGRYDLSNPDFEIAIPRKENPYRWRPAGRESMHDCFSRMTRDGSYAARMWVVRLGY